MQSSLSPTGKPGSDNLRQVICWNFKRGRTKYNVANAMLVLIRSVLGPKFVFFFGHWTSGKQRIWLCAVFANLKWRLQVLFWSGHGVGGYHFKAAGQGRRGLECGLAVWSQPPPFVFVFAPSCPLLCICSLPGSSLEFWVFGGQVVLIPVVAAATLLSVSFIPQSGFARFLHYCTMCSVHCLTDLWSNRCTSHT